MKMIAVMALKPGMVLADDVLNYKNERLFKANTTLDELAIAKLSRHSIMCVEVKEPEDFATTHFEKIRLSQGFKTFEATYNKCMPRYKEIIDGIIKEHKKYNIPALFSIYSELAGCAKTGELLLDYLYNMLPSEDDLTYAHCLNSALIAGVFATWIGSTKEDMFMFIQCGFFYDIGKLMLPKELIWKPSKLTDMEFELMKTHTFQGYHLLKELDIDNNIVAAALMHHERCDGTGYPSRLTDGQINKYAKFISIIDAYEAMTSARTYRESLIPFQVIENFERTSRFYSSIILNQVLQHIANSQLGSTVRLSDETLAEVILINQKKLSRPLVKCGDQVLDLSQYPDIKIVAVL